MKGIVNPAVLVIDIQNDFCSERELFKKRGLDISAIQTAVSRCADFIALSRKQGIPIVFIQAVYDRKYLPANIAEMYKKRGLTSLCQEGSCGADFYKISPLPNEKVFVKHRFDAFTNKELELWLRKKNIKTLVLTGCQTDVCVDSTARSGFMKGFNIVVIEDCVASTDQENHKSALKFMEKMYDAIIRTSKPFEKMPRK